MPKSLTPYFAPTYAFVGVCMLLTLTLAAVAVTYNMNVHSVRDHILASRDTTARTLEIWQRQLTKPLPFISSDATFIELIRTLERESGDDRLPSAAIQQAIANFLEPRYKRLGYEEYAIFSDKHRFLATSISSWNGNKVVQPILIDQIDKTLAHNQATVRTVVTRIPGKSNSSHLLPGGLGVILCAPIPSQHTPRTALCFRIDATQSLFDILKAGRPGETGETYAIGRDGRLLSPSRFTPSPPITLNAIDTSMAYPSLWARVPPQVNKPLTLARADDKYPLTEIATAMLSQHDTKFMLDYRDYRGIPVVGAAAWIDSLDIGLIVEDDMAEAFAPYRFARNVLSGLGLAAIALVIALTYVFIRSRRRLASSEHLRNTILTHVDAYVYLKDTEGRYLYVNSKVEELYGRTRDQILGRTDIELMPTKIARAFMEVDRQVLSTGERRALDEDVIDASGNFHRCWTIKLPIQLSEQSLGLIGISTDITELWKLQQELEARVEERTKDLQDARRAAEVATNAKSDFLANMSHEIRTPMNAIIGMSYLALQGELNASARNYLEKIQHAGQHLLGIINAILDYSKIEAGKLSIDASLFSLKQLVDNAITMVEPKAQQKQLALNVVTQPELPDALIGDSLRIGQVLTNFLSNAVKFTDDGTVTLHVTRMQSAQDDSSIRLCFAVEDTGIGMDASALAQLFQPFHQVDVSSERRFEGTGLGLAICKRIAKLLGGSVSATSELGKGSTFTLEVPLRIGTVEAISNEFHTVSKKDVPSVEKKDNDLRGLHILLVEDNEINQEVACDILKSFGMKVTVAGDGAVALTKLYEQSFDIVLMDVQMPILDGYRTAQAIRNDNTLPQPPIIAMTANALQGDRERCLAAGMNDYVAKPIEPDKLIAALQRWAPHTSATTNESAPTPSTLLNYTALQHLGLDTRKALTLLMQKEALYARVLRRFVDERADIPQQFNQALARNDCDSAAMMMHSLKSLAATIGADYLYELCNLLEAQLQAQQHTPEMCAQFCEEMQRLVTGLKPVLGNIGGVS